jgi:regulator of sigma E protease
MATLIFIIILAVLIFVHELGHFLVAKASKIRVDEFGIGFPPRIIGWKPKNSETTYTLNWIPFGGFVKIFGETPDEESLSGRESENSLTNKSKLTQVAVLAAGVSFNALFAWLLISIALMLGVPSGVDYGDKYLVDEPVLTVLAVSPGSPADSAGIDINDGILFAESNDVSLQGSMLTSENFQNLVNTSEGSVTLLINRDGDSISVAVAPADGITENSRAIGVVIDTIGIIKEPVHVAVVDGFKRSVFMTKNVAFGLWGFLTDALRGDAKLDQISGPVGIVGLVGDASKLGFANVLTFAAFISLSLAVINLVPFPALDGGRILFIIIETLKGSSIKPKVANVLNIVGFTFLILLMLVITFNDIVKLVIG